MLRRSTLSIPVLVASLTTLTTPVLAQGITQQQADQIINELRGIHQALERLAQTPPAAPAPSAPAPAPTAAAAPSGPSKVKLTNLAGYAMGKVDAPLTIVEFTDLQCPFCSRFHNQTFDEIKKNYIDTGKVRFISRDFPLSIHPQAMPAAIASRCAGEQGKFWELRTQLVRNASMLTPEYIKSSATNLKLNMADFQKCVDAGNYTAAVQSDMREGSGVGVTGTPSFVLGKTGKDQLEGTLIVGAQPYAAFEAAINELLAAPAAQ
jgi:protein-disulfide isomerase